MGHRDQAQAFIYQGRGAFYKTFITQINLTLPPLPGLLATHLVIETGHRNQRVLVSWSLAGKSWSTLHFITCTKSNNKERCSHRLTKDKKTRRSENGKNVDKNCRLISLIYI